MFEEKISGFKIGVKKKLTGQLSKSFGDVLYEQIVTFPEILNYGQITNDKKLNSQIWNSYREEERNLENYTIDGQGAIDINLNLPLTIKPMEVLEFEAKAIAAQSLKLSGKIIYDFTEEVIKPFQFILGNSLFVFKTHWDFKSSNSENFQFFTSIHKSYDGTEHRVQMVNNPRLNLNVNYTLFEDERRELEGYVYERLGDEMGIPLFSEMTMLKEEVNLGDKEILCSTKYSIFQEGKLAFLVNGNKNTIVEIESISQDKLILQNEVLEYFEKGTYIMPILKGYITDGINIDRITNDISRMSFMFRTKDNDNLNLNIFNNVNLPVHKSIPVMNIMPERAGHRNVFENEYEIVEYAYGPRYVKKKWQKAENSFVYSFINMNKEQQYNIKALINFSKGRLQEFWLPTWVRDVKLKSIIAPNETQIKMYYNNLANSYQTSNYNIRIMLKNGTEFYRKVLAFQNSPNENEEIITIESPLNTSITPEDIEIIDFIEKVRFDTDVFNLNIFSNEVSQINLTMRSSV
jgi:hypothetical protein